MIRRRTVRTISGALLLLAFASVMQGSAGAGTGDGGFADRRRTSRSEAQATNGDEADALVRRSRKLATREAFAGVVQVYWRDESQREFVEWVGARGLSGAFVVGQGDRRVFGHGDERLIDDASGGVGWTAAVDRAAPEPGAVWDLEITGTGMVAGRPTTLIEARDEAGRARAVFVIDDDRGQLLERRILDRRGDVVRSVGFLQIVTGAIMPAVPAGPSERSSAPTAIDHVPDGFPDPERTPAGYELLGRYRRTDGSIHLYYSDGLFTLSVFEQEGAIDWEELPPGRCAQIDGTRTCAYDRASGTIVIWSEDGLVFTAVGDGPPDLVDAVVDDFGAAGDTSWLDDVANFVLDPFGWK